MNEARERIYLDNAATSWPKPESVVEAVREFYLAIGSAAGRGSNQAAIDAQTRIDQCRSAIAKMINGRSSEIVFTSNGTASLNQAILGLLKSGDHVVTTQLEHNSVLRPLRELEANRGVEVSIVEPDSGGIVRPDELAAAITDRTRMIVTTHASNVLGTIQPVKEIGSIAKEREIVYLIDAAQTLGHIPIDVEELGCDLLAAPGHKSLLGPLGTGVLFVSTEIVDELSPLMYGGTGTNSESDMQPLDPPFKFESGNINTAAISGLLEGVRFLQSNDGQEKSKLADHLREEVCEQLKEVEGITVYGELDPNNRVNLVSFNIDGLDANEVAAILGSSYGVETRAGFHCAPLAHQWIKTDSIGGTVRMSWGPFNTVSQVQSAMDAVKEIAAANIF